MQSFVLSLKNTRTGKKLSSHTTKGVVIVLSEFFEYCVRRGFAASNPCKGVVLPKQIEKRIAVFDDIEQRQIISLLLEENSTKSLLVLTALFTGMRLGELCALTWSDIDVKNKFIHVSSTKQRVRTNQADGNKTSVITDMPKTRKSMRSIPITNYLIERLEVLHVLPTENTKHVFYKSSGAGYDTRGIQKYFSKVLKKLDIQNKNFHSLRHTFATTAIKSGMDVKTLSRVLGHNSIATTMNLYVHPDDDYTRSAMAAVIAYMFQEKDQ